MQAFVSRARRNLNLADFASASVPIALPAVKVTHPIVDRQYILRMMLRSPDQPLSIPPKLAWAKDLVQELDAHQKSLGLTNQYIYITVRHGIVDSTTDDQWHVDGFSMRVPHVPEQNYIYSTVVGTEGLVKNWNIPAGFDALKHNISLYFQDHQDEAEKVHLDTGVVHLIDPYFVHRRPPLTRGIHRTFIRVSFIPIEIEDDTCTRNPLFPEKKFNRPDVRKTLLRWN